MGDARRVLITGGAGFVGSAIAVQLARRRPGWQLVAFDNLRRRGSEVNLVRLRAAGVEFVHGDVRSEHDLSAAGPVDAVVECSAEASVLAGTDGSPAYVIDTNIRGTCNCLELARRHEAQVVFLSTSRVYPLASLRALELDEAETRFELATNQPLPGASADGISESFPLDGARTIYGTTKLAGEQLVEEYAAAYGLQVVIDRCGVISGPGQLGKAEQGVFGHWLLAHHFGRSLRYIGYGGRGKQVRDLLHVDDLVELVEDQLLRPEHWVGVKANVGGGRACSLSLHEATVLCRELTGTEVPIDSVPDDRPGDVPLYLSDCARLFAHTDWRPRRDARTTLAEMHEWITENERQLEEALL